MANRLGIAFIASPALFLLTANEVRQTLHSLYSIPAGSGAWGGGTLSAPQQRPSPSTSQGATTSYPGSMPLGPWSSSGQAGRLQTLNHSKSQEVFFYCSGIGGGMGQG